MNEFKSGDLVKLKSGGPVMTVGEDAAHNGNCFCYWYNPATSSISTAVLPAAVLTPVSTPELEKNPKD